MRKKRELAQFFLIILGSIMLSGCWNYRDIENLDIASAVAIDKNEKGDKYLITVETVGFEAGAEIKIKAQISQMSGNTVFDAIRNSIMVSGRRIYWGTLKSVILSQDIAKSGAMPVIDFLSRDAEIPNVVRVLVSKQKTAKELLMLPETSGELHGFKIDGLLTSQSSLAKAPQVGIFDFVNSLTHYDGSTSVPVASIAKQDGKKQILVGGTAFFKKGKLIGFLNPEDTKYYLFIKNKVEYGLLVEGLRDKKPEDRITLEIFKSHTEVEPEYKKGKIIMHIKVKTQVAIGSHGMKGNYIDQKGRKKLEAIAERSLEDSITALVKKANQRFKTDVFAFGSVLNKEEPELWKRIEKDWDKKYKDVKVQVDAKIEIRNSALLAKPVQIGD